MTLRQIVEQWVERFNTADGEGLAVLYGDSATNQQVANEPVVGRSAIHARPLEPPRRFLMPPIKKASQEQHIAE